VKQENCRQGFAGDTRGKEPFGRSSRRWEDNTEVDLQEVGSGGVDWVDLAEDRWWTLLNAVMNLRFPKSAGNLLII
jgi:hypothetical protein